MESPLIVNLKVYGPSKIAITDNEKREISDNFSDLVNVCWLDDKNQEESNFRPKKREVKYFTLETMVLVFIAGVGVSSLAKPFLNGFLGEAGKDSWQLLKKVFAKIWKTQNQKSYSIKNNTIVIMEENSIRIAVEMRLRDIEKQSMDKDYDSFIDRMLDRMFEDLPRISKELSGVSNSYPDTICVIRQTNDGWRVWEIQEKTFRAKYMTPPSSAV